MNKVTEMKAIGGMVMSSDPKPFSSMAEKTEKGQRPRPQPLPPGKAGERVLNPDPQPMPPQKRGDGRKPKQPIKPRK